MCNKILKPLNLLFQNTLSSTNSQKHVRYAALSMAWIHKLKQSWWKDEDWMHMLLLLYTDWGKVRLGETCWIWLDSYRPRFRLHRELGHRRTLFPSVVSQTFDVAQTLYKILPKNGDLAHWFLKIQMSATGGVSVQHPRLHFTIPQWTVFLFWESRNLSLSSFSWWKLHNTPAKGS